MGRQSQRPHGLGDQLGIIAGQQVFKQPAVEGLGRRIDQLQRQGPHGRGPLPVLQQRQCQVGRSRVVDLLGITSVEHVQCRQGRVEQVGGDPGVVQDGGDLGSEFFLIRLGHPLHDQSSRDRIDLPITEHLPGQLRSVELPEQRQRQQQPDCPLTPSIPGGCTECPPNGLQQFRTGDIIPHRSGQKSCHQERIIGFQEPDGLLQTQQSHRCSRPACPVSPCRPRQVQWIRHPQSCRHLFVLEKVSFGDVERKLWRPNEIDQGNLHLRRTTGQSGPLGSRTKETKILDSWIDKSHRPQHLDPGPRAAAMVGNQLAHSLATGNGSGQGPGRSPTQCQAWRADQLHQLINACFGGHCRHVNNRPITPARLATNPPHPTTTMNLVVPQNPVGTKQAPVGCGGQANRPEIDTSLDQHLGHRLV